MKGEKRINATIELDGNFRIDVDNYNWILRYESEPHDKVVRGEMKERVVSKEHWYYPTLKTCLMGYMDKSCRESSSITALLRKIEEVEQRIENICHHENLYNLTNRAQ